MTLNVTCHSKNKKCFCPTRHVWFSKFFTLVFRLLSMWFCWLMVSLPASCCIFKSTLWIFTYRYSSFLGNFLFPPESCIPNFFWVLLRFSYRMWIFICYICIHVNIWILKETVVSEMQTSTSEREPFFPHFILACMSTHYLSSIESQIYGSLTFFWHSL